MLKEEKRERVMSDWTIIKRTWQYIKPQLWKFVLALIFMFITVGLDLLGPVITSEAIKVLSVNISQGEVVNFNKLLLLIGIYIVAIVSSLGFIYVQTMMLQKIGQTIIYNLRNEVFSHIDNLSLAQMNEIPVGKLVTRVTNDTSALNDLFTNILVNTLKNAITLIGVIIMMFIYDWETALYLIAFIPVIAFFSYVFRKKSKARYREVRNNISSINAFLSENISGMKITQIFNQENTKAKEFIEKNNKLKKSKYKEILVYGIFRPLISVLYILAITLVFFIGSKRVQAGAIGIDVVWALYSYTSKFFNPIQSLAEQFNGLQKAFAASERLYILLDTPPIVQNTKNAREINNFKGKIEFKNVWFAYEKEDWILKNVSFVIEPKQTVAFVGATGAGKSTILGLIVRNHEIQKGQILIDDIDIRDIKIESLRKNIGQMLQDVFIFSGTIKSNINLRDETISDEEIKKACEYVNANYFIESLPKGLDEPVQEKGANFSSGQRQLLSFARTVVHKPQILILDEATANIDTETEVLIQKSLEKMMNIGTMLIVAHRLSTIQHASNIIVLQHGEIIEQGTHQQLLKKNGYYYSLYKLQFEGQENK